VTTKPAQRATQVIVGPRLVSDVSSPTVTIVNGKYIIERRLGGGGMAEVFLGRTIGAEGFSRPVAIKRILTGFAQNPAFANLFIEEARLTARLQHPNIVQVLDLDRDHEGGLFLVMELVDGVTLHGLLQRCSLPLSLVIHVTLEILRGLDYAHELPVNVEGVRGIVHRDLSPDNVLLSWEGAVKVSDFGVAKAREATKASASVTIRGKPSYMSPEQVNAAPLDGRSDLFAVGAMMFEMLCARPLFAGGTHGETFGQVLYSQVPSVRDIRPDIPEDLSRVVASLLTRELDRRMPSAEAAIAALVCCANLPRAGREELVEALSQQFKDRAPVRPRNISSSSHSNPTMVGGHLQPLEPPHVTATAPSVAGSEISGLNGTAQRAQRRRRWGWAVLAGLLIVAGAVGVLTWGANARSRTATQPPAIAPAAAQTAKPATLELDAATPATAEPDTARSKEPATKEGLAPTESGAHQDSALPSVGATPQPTRTGIHTPAKHDRSHAPVRPPHDPPGKQDGIREIDLSR
jgi:serine/threonine protein kinase